jgi:hypothetical protein
MPDQLYIITHVHEYGATGVLAWCGHSPNENECTQVLEDYDPATDTIYVEGPIKEVPHIDKETV